MLCRKMALRAESSYTLDLLSRFSCRFPSTLPEEEDSHHFPKLKLDFTTERRGGVLYSQI